MDFYETSACTNLNIKEVRAPKPRSPASAAQSRGAARSGEAAGQRRAPPRPRAATGLQGEEEAAAHSPAALGFPVFHAADGAGAASPQEGAGWSPDTRQHRVGIGRAGGRGGQT